MKALAIRHVRIEHLGLLEPILKELGFDVDYVDTAEGMLLSRPLENYSFVVVLGGYMGAYEEAKYPFLSYEYKVMEKALKEGIPLLGICLGAQMLAKVLGARVYKGERGKEIGWMEVYKVGDHEYFKDFPQSLMVFQWHGDTFDLPQGAVRLYSSEKYENQAFVFQRAVGLQFHIEVDKNMVKEWAEVYKDELSQEGIQISQLLAYEGESHRDSLQKLIKRLLNL